MEKLRILVTITVVALSVTANAGSGGGYDYDEINRRFSLFNRASGVQPRHQTGSAKTPSLWAFQRPMSV